MKARNSMRFRLVLGHVWWFVRPFTSLISLNSHMRSSDLIGRFPNACLTVRPGITAAPQPPGCLLQFRSKTTCGAPPRHQQTPPQKKKKKKNKNSCVVPRFALRAGRHTIVIAKSPLPSPLRPHSPQHPRTGKQQPCTPTCDTSPSCTPSQTFFSPLRTQNVLFSQFPPSRRTDGSGYKL